MTAYDIVFLLLVLIAILAGIGLGVHLAYRLAQDRYGDDEYRPYRTDDYFAEKETKTDKPKTSIRDKKKSGRLSERVRKKEAMSFSEFDCQFSGEDHTEKLERVMGEQDDAYNCLGEKVKKP